MAKTPQAPDPATRQRRFTLPPGSCDAHCHIFGPAAKFPYDPMAAYHPHDAPFEALCRLHEILGIERAVIVHASCHGADMRATLDGIARSGGRFRGTAIIDEDCTDAELRRLDECGIRGVRFNFVRHLGGPPESGFFRRTVERARALGWHLILHLGAQDIVDYADLFRALPVPIVIDHMARVSAASGLEQPPFEVLMEFMRDENVWVKVCGAERVSSMGPPFTDAIPFARALIDAAPERVLWGTDWPHPNVKHMPNDGELVDLIPLMMPDAATQKQILVDNPARLYGF
jgi:predicted TIM-barrel fold metal-dependent hydrolase